MSTSQGRELISESLRLLAWTRDGERESQREREKDRPKKRKRERDGLRSVTRMEEKSDGQGACERE